MKGDLYGYVHGYEDIVGREHCGRVISGQTVATTTANNDEVCYMSLL